MNSRQAFINEIKSLAKTRDAYDDVDEGIGEARQKISPNAIMGGSRGLGLSTDKSDTDLFVPVDDKEAFDRLIVRLLRETDLVPSMYNLFRKDKWVLRDDDDPLDVAIRHGDKATEYVEGYRKAARYLDEHKRMRDEARQTKKGLKETTPHLYNKYKRTFDKNLGLLLD